MKSLGANLLSMLLVSVVTCPDENKAVGLHRRLTAEAICRVCSQLTREV